MHGRPCYSLEGSTHSRDIQSFLASEGVKFLHNRDLQSFLASEGVKFLLSTHGEVPLSRIEGKTICILFSANWCRPCKTFTPLLAQVYDTLKSKDKCLEIVFVSFDKDKKGFKEHFKRLRDFYHIDRISSLVHLCFDGRSIDEDVVGLIKDYGANSFPFTKKRKEELIALDNVKHQGRKLEELSANDEKKLCHF
ncbi:Thioredoxin-like fold [Dillenia turbinata]|uniref:protein-disulfide reductase n=1 Tax=Dillenia turbinata TaxID=194707 RepID=A0AAN8V5B0_9MAGN